MSDYSARKKKVILFISSLMLAFAMSGALIFSFIEELEYSSSVQANIFKLERMVNELKFVVNKKHLHKEQISKTDSDYYKNLLKEYNILINDLPLSKVDNQFLFNKIGTIFKSDYGSYWDNLNYLSKSFVTIIENNANEQLYLSTVDNFEILNTFFLKANTFMFQRLKKIKIGLVSFGIFSLGLIFSSFFFAVMRVYVPWKNELYLLQEERDRLQEVVGGVEDQGQTFSWEMDIESKKVKRSNRLKALLNFDEDSDENEYLYDELSMFDEFSRRKFVKVLEEAILKRGSFELDVHMISKNNKNYWFKYAGKYVEKDGVDKVTALVRDITSSKVSESRFHNIFNNNMYPMFVMNDQSILMCNKAAVKYFGFDDFRTATNTHPSILFPVYQEDGYSSIERVKKILKEVHNGNTYEGELSFKTNEDVVQVSDVNIRSIEGGAGNLHLLSILTNSDRLLLEKQVLKSRRKMNYYNRRRVEFASELMGLFKNTVDKVLSTIPSQEIINVIDEGYSKLNSIWNEEMTTDADIVEGIFSPYGLTEGLISKWTSKALECKVSTQFSNLSNKKELLIGDESKIKVCLEEFFNYMISFESGTELNVEISTTVDDTKAGVMDFRFNLSGLEDDGESLKHDLNRFSEYSLHHSNMHEKMSNVLRVIEIIGAQMNIRIIKSVGVSVTLSFPLYSVVAQTGTTSEIVLDGASVFEKTYATDDDLSLNQVDVWNYFSGDWDIIKLLGEEFISYYPAALEEMEKAIDERDFDHIAYLSEGLYGVLSYLPFTKSQESIIKIQKLAKYGIYSELRDEFKILSSNIQELSTIVEKFLPRNIQKAA